MIGTQCCARALLGPLNLLLLIQGSGIEAGPGRAPTSRAAEAAVRPPPIQSTAPLATTKLPPISTAAKRRQPPAPTPPAIQQIPFMTQTRAAQQQPPTLEEVTLSPTKSASSVKIENGSPGAPSAPTADTGRAEQVQSGTQHGSPRHDAGTTTANNGHSPRDRKEPTDESIPGSPHTQSNADLTPSGAPASTASAASDDEMHAAQEPSNTEDAGKGPLQSNAGDMGQDQQPASAHSQSVELFNAKVSPSSSPVTQAIPFSSQGNTDSPEAAAPADIQRAASPHPTVAPRSGRDAMDSQVSLPGDSHARAAAVAEAIRRASQASEPEQGTTKGRVQWSIGLLQELSCIRGCV